MATDSKDDDWGDTTKWEELTIASWAHFDEVVDSLDHRQWLFRGQSNAAWSLDTSLSRLFSDLRHLLENDSAISNAAEFEKCLVEKFQANAFRFLKSTPPLDDLLEWWAVMQHHGAPTRLLDVSQSPYIAAYFALESGADDAAVFAFNYRRFEQLDDSVLEIEDYREKLLENLDETFLRPFEPKLTSERLSAQQGLFLVPSNVGKSIDWILGEYGSAGRQCRKLVIPSALRRSGLQRLRRMNISAGTLFPGMDGFCRSLRHELLDPPETWRRIF